MTDIVWCAIGFILGYAIAHGTRARDIPEKLETCDSDRLKNGRASCRERV